MYTAIGERLKSLRGKISRYDFADRFKVSSGSLVRWEGGERAPDILFLTRLAKEFGVTIDWILTGEGDGPAAVDSPKTATIAGFSPRQKIQQPENIELEKEKPATSQVSSSALADLNAKLMTLKDELLELTRQHADLRVEREQLKYDLEVRQRAMEGLARHVAELGNERAGLIEERDSLRVERDSLREMVEKKKHHAGNGGKE